MRIFLLADYGKFAGHEMVVERANPEQKLGHTRLIEAGIQGERR